MFENRLLWGSDWPHTSFEPDAMPAYASTWAPVRRVLSAAQQAQAFEQGPATLYA